MTLTVPRSTRDPGRAPDIRVPEPTLGADIAGFGQVMQRVGIGLQREQQGRQLDRAKIDMMSGLNDLRLELENSGDPDLIDSSFPERAGALRETILSNLPEAIREQAALSFDDMAERNRFALGRTAIGLRQSQYRVNLGDMQTQVIRGATGMDPDSRAAYLADFEGQIARAVTAGVLDPEQGARLLDQTETSMAEAQAQLLLREDPQALLADLESGALFGHSETARQRWITRTQAAMDTAENARRGEMRDHYREATRIIQAGRTPANMDDLVGAIEDFADLPEANRFGLAVALADARPDFALMTPEQMRDALAAEEARSPESADELVIADAMRDALDAAEAAWREDRIGHAEALGLGDPGELPDPRAGNGPQARADLAAALRARGHFAEALREAGYVDDVALFRPEEREAFAEVAGAMAPPPERVALAWAFGDAFGEDAHARAAELGADPVFAHVAGWVHHGGGEALARDIFEGQRALANDDVPLPAQNRMRQQFFVAFGELFDHHHEMNAREPIIDAAMALYAQGQRDSGALVEGAFAQTDQRAFDQAVHEVLGGTGKFGSSDATGGVQEINKHRVMVPAGIGWRDLSRAWRVVNSAATQPDQLQAILRDISVADPMSMSAPGMPSFGGEPLGPREWQAGRWVPMGHGRYALAFGDGDGETFAVTEDGDPWQFDIWALLRRAGAR